MPDVLSDIFDTIRLRATLYFRTDYSPPWAVTVPAYERAARFHLVIQGRCHVALASGRSADLNTGDLVLIPHGREHSLADAAGRSPAPLETVVRDSGYDGRGVFVVGRGDPTASTQMICGHFGFTEAADHLLLRSLPEMIVLTPADRARHALLDETLRLVTRRVFTDELGAAAAISRLSEVFFIEAVRASIGQCPELARILGAMTDIQVGRALELMHNDPARAWRVESLAVEVGMSRSRFADRFAELMGQGPMAYLTEWRLQKALARLGGSEVSINKLARETGYQSPAAFTRAFAQRFGMSPSDYRSEEIQIDLQIVPKSLPTPRIKGA
jgi:AraC family transcriptional regulator, activator of mtrCDE